MIPNEAHWLCEECWCCNGDWRGFCLLYLFASCYYQLSAWISSTFCDHCSGRGEKHLQYCSQPLSTFDWFFFWTIVNSIYKNTQLDLKYFEINPRCHQTAENISYQTFFVSLSSGLSLVSHVLWGVISLSLLTRDPDLSDEETKITQPDPWGSIPGCIPDWKDS